MAKEVRVRQGKAGQGRAGQGRAGQSSTQGAVAGQSSERTTHGAGHLIGILEALGQAKVGQSHVAGMSEQNVVQLEVAEDNLLAVQEEEAQTAREA